MIYNLTSSSRGVYSNILDYAKFLLEKINGSELILISDSSSIGSSILFSSTTVFTVRQFNTFEEFTNRSTTLNLSNAVVVTDLNKVNPEFIELIETIPFVLFFNQEEIETFIESNKIPKGFIFQENDRKCLLTGKYSLIKPSKLKRVLAVVATFNDKDIIGQVIDDLINQDVDILLIDNWSSDGTEVAIEECRKKFPNRIFVVKFPENGPDQEFEWKKILDYKASNPISRSYDWIIHCDSDELRLSPWANTTLREAISFIDSLGFNVIDSSVMNFRPTVDGFTNTDSLESFFKHFEFGVEAGDFLRMGIWKNIDKDVDLSFHFGHDVIFEGKKVFPLKFLIKHYPLRSSEQAYRKIFKERIPRYKKAHNDVGVDTHYNKFKEDQSLLWKEEGLIEYKNDKDFYTKHFIEATSSNNITVPGKVAIILGFVKEKNENLLIEAIKRINEQSYREFDIYIYDNSEIKDSLSKTRELFPKVYIKKNIKNCGFAGGNNSVMREVLKTNQYEYVALLNDDTQVHVDWLANLVESAKKSEEIGAVTSKLIFYESYIRLSGKTETFNPKEIGTGEDTRNLGIKLFLGESRFENTHYTKKFLRDGFYGMEGEYTWSDSQFQLDLPIGIMPVESDYELIFTIEGSEHVTNQSVQVKIDSFVSEIEMEKSKKTYKITVPRDIILKNKFDLIQNASSGISAQFNGYDIGSLNGNAEIDEGQYEEEKEAEMICGGAVLFNANALRKVGIFDEYYFVYYEDSDLSLRIKKEGYKLIYQPKAVVRHIHAGSSSEYSPLFTYHVWKNKPAFVIKNFNIGPSIFALKELALIGFREVKDAVIKHKLRSGYHNSRLKVILKSTIKFYTNLPLILLKKYKIIKSS